MKSFLLTHLTMIGRACALAALTAASVASAAAGSKLVIKGSDTLGAKMVPQLAEAFRLQHPDVTFEIAAEGSTTGITAIIDSTADIGMSSRPARPTEVSQGRVKNVTLQPVIVSYDAMAVVVNKDNPIEELTLRQVEQIFTGDVTDWSAVGAKQGAISVYTRNTSSGTYQDWKALAMNRRDYAASSQKMAGNEQIAAEVGKNPSGIGYVGIAYTKAEGVRVVPIRAKDGKLVSPTAEAVHAGEYPYARPNFFYTNGLPEGLAAEFVTFVLSAEGQDIVEKSGFVKVADGKRP